MAGLPSSIGPYRIIRLLGEGGMGAVFEARQEPLDRRVAVKTLHAESARNKDSVARFFNEAKVLSRLEHPSIVQVSDFGHTPSGTAYLVMEFLRGQSLAQRMHELLKRDERLPVVTALQFAWQVADVLAVAHAQGIVHRDLKPDNLMLVADPVAPGGERVKILDFGIAKLTSSGERGAVKTDTQAVMGTPLYMSPEQCAGAGGVDARTDVYSLGCVLYEVLSGQPPFIAEGAGQLVGMHLFREPEPLASLAPKLPPKVAELVHLFLTKDKAQRPSMSDACDEIGKLLVSLSGGGPVVRSRPHAVTANDARSDADLGIAATTPGPSTTLGQSIGQKDYASAWKRRAIALFAVGLLLLGTLAGLLLRSSRSPISATPQPSVVVVPPPAVAPTLPAVELPSPQPASARSAPGVPKPEPRPLVRRPPSKPEPTKSLPVNRAKPAKSSQFGYED